MFLVEQYYLFIFRFFMMILCFDVWLCNFTFVLLIHYIFIHLWMVFYGTIYWIFLFMTLLMFLKLFCIVFDLERDSQSNITCFIRVKNLLYSILMFQWIHHIKPQIDSNIFFSFKMMSLILFISLISLFFVK